MSNKELANEVGLSPSPCWQRVKLLKAEGFLGGCVAKFDLEKLGAPDMIVMEVSLERNTAETFDAFAEAIQHIPEIVEAHETTGDYDVLLKVMVSGTQGYQNFLTKKFYKIPGVSRTRSNFTLHCAKNVQAFVPD